MKEEDDETESNDHQAHELLMKRCSRNELILRFLSMLCVALMFALFILQLDILWRARQSFVMEVLIPDSQDIMFAYPPFFYDIGHSEDIWTWDPKTHLLKSWNRILKAFANSLDPDKTPNNVASHQDPNCLLF